jgi:hypothetical protein
LAAVLFALVTSSARAEKLNEYQLQAETRFHQAQIAWSKAGRPGESSPEGDELVDAAIHVQRRDCVEQVLAGGSLLKCMIPIPRGGQRITLHTLHTFRTFHADLDDEVFASMEHSEHGWLARRITRNALEVWAPQRGWLFDGRGHLLHKADPQRHAGWGRQWYGAFLPDGRWVTTDIDDMDGKLQFYSANGQWLRMMTCDQLAPPTPDGDSNLIGWARSDEHGTGWVVNVGSEEGRATVWVGPDGPARVLKAGERWDLCYPRALGPRGWYIEMSVPDDGHHGKLGRAEAGHGPGVGFPTYSSDAAEGQNRIVPDGNYVFGYWPGETSFFVGSEAVYQSEDRPDSSGMRSRVRDEDLLHQPVLVIDKTWFFDSQGKVLGWLRARRIGDATDGKSMVFRVTADSRIATLDPDLKIKTLRNFVWKDESTADAVALWDDLHLGLFIRDHHVVLARWRP